MGFRLASLRRTNVVVMAPDCTRVICDQRIRSIDDDDDDEKRTGANGNKNAYETEQNSRRVSTAIVNTFIDDLDHRNLLTRSIQLQLMYVKVYRIFVVLVKKQFGHVNNSGDSFGCVIIVAGVSRRDSRTVAVAVDGGYVLKDHRRFYNAYNINRRNLKNVCDCFVRRCIMNKGASMGDKLAAATTTCNTSINNNNNNSNMGLQKIDTPTFEASIGVKEKRYNILANFDRDMCRNGNNFQQDCEEFLQIMATAKTSSSPPHATAAAIVNGDETREEQPSDTTLATEEFEKNLLANRDVIAMETEESAVVVAERKPETISTVNDFSTETGEEYRKRCVLMERRIDRLSRRLKLKQTKLYGLHTSEQIAGLLEYCSCKYAELQAVQAEQQQNTSHSTAMTVTPMKPSIDSYMKRLKRYSEQSCVPQNNEKHLCYFGSGTKETKNGRNIVASAAPALTDDVREHIEKISGQLHAQMKAIASDFDSDVTASSSGNESLDEETTLSTTDVVEERMKKLPLTKRALWRWLRNRASIAYRLSWLQSHMSELEYKIHHYTELYKKLRSAKGQITLQQQQTSGVATTDATTTNNGICVPTSTASSLLQSKNNAHIVLNGYHGSLATSTSSDTCVDATKTTVGVGNGDETTTTTKECVADVVSGGVGSTGVEYQESDGDGCSRTRPLAKTKFRKRNLIRADTLQPTLNSGGATFPKFASVRCDCVPPSMCVLCASRGPGVDLANRHLYANLLPTHSKIALLEPTYHPVLSFPSDVSVSTHIGALLNNENVLESLAKTIETRTAPRTAPQTAVKRHYSNNYKSSEEIRRTNSENMEIRKKRKYVRRLANNSQTVLFARNQLGKQRRSKLDKTLSFRKRRRKRLRTNRVHGKDNGLEDSPDEGLYYRRDDVYSSQPGSPHSSHSSSVKDPIKRKRGQSYDIDNFIIPPNSTPVVVVSKPQYKEILIPTWKVIPERPLTAEELDRSSLQSYILEDLSDDKVVQYHEALELSERKKFRTNPTRPSHGRGRKRTDSCPETSEANTPERVASPVSSTSNTDLNDTTGPLSNTTTTTAINVTQSNNVAHASCTVASTNLTNVTTNKVKLTLTKTKTSLDCDNASVTDATSAETTPYELRKFPLSDEDYKRIVTTQPIKYTEEEDEATTPTVETMMVNENVKPHEECRQLSIVLKKLVTPVL